MVSHGNTLRALIKHLDGVSDEASAKLTAPNAVPLRYELDTDLKHSANERAGEEGAAMTRPATPAESAPQAYAWWPGSLSPKMCAA